MYGKGFPGQPPHPKSTTGWNSKISGHHSNSFICIVLDFALKLITLHCQSLDATLVLLKLSAFALHFSYPSILEN